MTRPSLRRRALAAATSAAIGIAAIGVAAMPAAQAQTVLKVLIDGNVTTVDPVVTTESMAIQHGFMVYDQLFALDAQGRPQPQMVASYERSADGLKWRFVLRDGLKFHDGSPVEAKDVVPSLRRWAARKASGAALIRHVEALEAVDARTFEMRLSRPFGPVLEMLADPLNALFIMRAAEASTDPATPLTTSIGSGPFRFIQQGWKPGDKAVYQKNADYVPRSEPASAMAGGKVVKVDRVEYWNIPDATTSAQALISGEVDIITFPQLALMQVFERAPGIEVLMLNPIGEQGVLRVNHLVPPFNHPKAREALLYLLGNQTDHLSAIVRLPKLQMPCWSIFGCGTPLETKAGIGDWAKGTDVEKARALLREAGYDGRPVVILDAPSQGSIHAMSLVTAQKLRQAGVTVDVQAMDLAAWAARRNERGDPKTTPNGWNIFHTAGKMISQGNPLANAGVVAACDGKNWVGWPCDEELQKQLEAYAFTPSDGQKAWVDAYQTRYFQALPYVPVGQFLLPTVSRTAVTGLLPVQGYPVMWNVQKR
jgi:peptide/nickel transport system substrate-binding protein